MMNPWAILAAVLAVVAAAVGGYFKGDHDRNVAWVAQVEKDRGDAERAARATESMWQGVVNGTVSNYDRKVRAIRSDLDDALGRLRDRPDRPAALPEGPRPECQGGTGAELYRADAEFLVREAARADVVRAGLVACYEVLDVVTP